MNKLVYVDSIPLAGHLKIDQLLLDMARFIRVKYGDSMSISCGWGGCGYNSFEQFEQDIARLKKKYKCKDCR